VLGTSLPRVRGRLAVLSPPAYRFTVVSQLEILESMTNKPKPTPGTVYLVGAGPGDPGLITLRAVECLAQADVVLYDYLANPTSLEHAASGAKLVRLGDSEAGRRPSQDEINALMVEAALEGKTVVRLKGGDPSVFGRSADETEALNAAGVPFEIVPGITTGLAVGAD